GNSGDRFQYTGREYDSAVKLQYNRARYYDAALGKWVSVDPIGFEAGDANLYRYVGNAPTNHTDPSGLDYTWYTITNNSYTYTSNGQKGWRALFNFKFKLKIGQWVEFDKCFVTLEYNTGSPTVGDNGWTSIKRYSMVPNLLNRDSYGPN